MSASYSGAVGGAAQGAAAGTAISPGYGTAVGALAGAVSGALGGSLTDSAADEAKEAAKIQADFVRAEGRENLRRMSLVHKMQSAEIRTRAYASNLLFDGSSRRFQDQVMRENARDRAWERYRYSKEAELIEMGGQSQAEALTTAAQVDAVGQLVMSGLSMYAPASEEASLAEEVGGGIGAKLGGRLVP